MVNVKTAKREKKFEFEIKDNILVGDDLTYPENYDNVGEIILEILRSEPDHIGQIEATTGKQSTYKEMLDKSVRCAIWLRKAGVKPGDVVAVCSSCYCENYIPFLACLYIGAQCAIEYHQLPARTFRHFLSIVTPKIIFLHAHALDNLIKAQNETSTNIRRVIFEDQVPNEESLDAILSEQTVAEIEKFRCEDIENPKHAALLIGTSGSTGVPKVAELSHLALKTMMHPVYAKIPDRVWLCVAGMRWITYFWNLLGGLRSNATRVIAEDAQSAKYYLEIIRKYEIEYYGADTNQLRQIYKLGLINDYRETKLKTLRFGGSPFSRDIHETLIKELPQINTLQAYGSTDIGNVIVAQKPGSTPGSCGFIRPGIKLKVVCTQTGVALGPNKHGEICVKSNTRINKYRGNPIATRNAIDSEGWFHMGDIGYYDEVGELYIVGRTSQFIKYNDCCLSVLEMETIFDMHPDVYKAVVIPVPSEIEGELPVAVVEKLPDKEITEHELLTYFKKNMPEFYMLKSVKFVKEMPRTSTGKIARNDLKQMLCVAM
ncbi:luciferin 4-monooxygenase-like isoform X2 [Ceratina calcarata]|uniref:Luciferin 4-monooxygenase-like isoform X2 n=1 Tax=Ceratina calcarata TaxID=156304 RepID=A0AAJ7WD53_9HYME|nr:luciferin 4-monooxygenase-like isoform X2 [Ceratina calcarata]